MINKCLQGTRFVSSLILTALLSMVSTYVWALDLETVLENTAVTPPSRVDFVEQRFNRLLKDPMALTGYLEYVEAGQLRKVIESPFAEAFFITQDYIEIERGGKSRRLSLRKSKTMKAMFGGIEAILAGEPDKLASLFRYELTGTAKAWTMRLEPLSSRISAHLTAMLVAGDEDSVNSIRMELKDGEWSLMELTHTKPEP